MKYLFLITFLFQLLSVASVLADQTDRDSAQLFESVMSPYCPGMTLSACPSDDARILRDEIRLQLEKGVSKEKIEADLRTRFGNLSGAPVGSASGGIAYIGILVFFAVGIGIIGLNIRKKTEGE